MSQPQTMFPAMGRRNVDGHPIRKRPRLNPIIKNDLGRVNPEKTDDGHIDVLKSCHGYTDGQNSSRNLTFSCGINQDNRHLNNSSSISRKIENVMASLQNITNESDAKNMEYDNLQRKSDILTRNCDNLSEMNGILKASLIGLQNLYIAGVVERPPFFGVKLESDQSSSC